MKKFSLISLVLLILCAGCHVTNPDGLYLVYKTETPSNYGQDTDQFNEQASEKLREMFKGKYISLTFKKNYLILKEDNKGDDMILNEIENSSPDHGKFELIYTKGNERVKLTLYKERAEDNSIECTLSVWITQLRRGSGGQFLEGKYARALCSLEKQDSQSSTVSRDHDGFEKVFPNDEQHPPVEEQRYATPENPPIYETIDTSVADTVIELY